MTYVQAGLDGLERAVFEAPGTAGPLWRLAARRVGADKGPRLETAINERAARVVEGSGFDRAALYAPALGLLFQVFPFDDRLPSLPTAVDGVAMIPVLEAALAGPSGGGRLESVAPRVVKYKPERKCVLRYDLAWRRAASPTAPTVVWARISRRARFERTHGILSLLYRVASGAGFVSRSRSP